MRKTLTVLLVGLMITLFVAAQTKSPVATKNSSQFMTAHAQGQSPMRNLPTCAPETDRVGFPDGFPDNYTLLSTFDRSAGRGTIQYLYGNAIAASAKPGKPFPYGSVLVLDPYVAQLGADGQPILDDDGRFIPGEPVSGLGVMRKEKGFGEDYCEDRAGEWEFVSYHFDGSFETPPQESWMCAQCHKLAGAVQLTGAVTDYVYRMNLHFANASGAVADAVMLNISFLPRNFEVKEGSTVTWYNDDRERHNIVSDNGAFEPLGIVEPGSTSSHKFTVPGEYSYHCTIHGGMKHGKVVVTAK
jgi:plastocyanin